MSIDFKKKMAFKKDDKQPRKHPPLENDCMRFELPEIKGETTKATLFDFKDENLKNNGMVWIPKSCYTIKWRPRYEPLPGDDKEDVIDIKTWFYEKEIEK